MASGKLLLVSPEVEVQRTTADRCLDIPKVVPLTCHGHSRPVPHINFSSTVEDDQYYLISACKGRSFFLVDYVRK